MAEHQSMAQGKATPLAFRIAPGLKLLFAYRREWLSHDMMAGVSVAAVALPSAIAYAQLAGFAPVVGLYASILPLLAYALFGTSRQLIVNPDAATCAIVAAIVAPLSGGDPSTYLSLYAQAEATPSQGDGRSVATPRSGSCRNAVRRRNLGPCRCSRHE